MRRTVLVWRPSGSRTSLARAGAEARSRVGRPISRPAGFLAGPGFSGMSSVRKMLGTVDLLTLVRDAAHASRRRRAAQPGPAFGVTGSRRGAVVDEARHGVRSRRD